MDAITPTSTTRKPWIDYLPGAVLLLAVLIAATAFYPSSRLRATETTRVTGNMLVAAAALNTTGTTYGAAYMPQCRESVVYVKWGAGTGAGGVTIESADDSTYTGTWAPLAVVAWTAASKEDIVQITGIHLNLRSRVSTLVTGGTVSTILGCN